MAAPSADPDGTALKELLCRAETERLRLAQQASGLADDKQQLTVAMRLLQQQLADAHAAFADSQSQALALADANAKLQLQLAAATTAYRCNDIIGIGLRDAITRLEQELRDSRDACRSQASQMATFADDMAELQQAKADVGQQLECLAAQHGQLQARHSTATTQLEQSQQEMQHMRSRWQDEHSDQAEQLGQRIKELQQQQDSVAQLTQQLKQEQQQLAAAQARCAEQEGELGATRELVMLLGKALGKLPAGQQLPGHEDPVWAKPGPLGGVAHALDVAIKYTREQQLRVKEVQAAHDQLEDRCRSEAAQNADLQAELFDVRTLYAQAIAVREALEARTAQAEAEKAAADSTWQSAKAQAAVDAVRLAELQQAVLLLTQQVQILQPLQPLLSTTEVERDTALHKLERLQEQHDQLQRQLGQAVGRETVMAAEVEAYKLEHSQLLTANSQLVAQCTTLNNQVQALEVNAREGCLAQGQLDDARQKLRHTKTQLAAMADRHSETLTRLENTQELLATPSAVFSTDAGCHTGAAPANRSSSRPTSAWSRSRPGTAHQPVLQSGSSSGTNSPRASSVGVQWAPSVAPAAAAAASLSSQADARACSAAAPSAGKGHELPSGTEAADGAAAARHHNAAAELDALLRQKQLEQLLLVQQQAVMELQAELGQQQHKTAGLELQLLLQEAAHLQELQAREAAVGEACLLVAGEATAALAAALQGLQHTLAGPADSASGDAAADGCQAGSNVVPQQPDSHPTASWLRGTAQCMLANVQLLVGDAQARAVLQAARQSVGAQSNEPLQQQWLLLLAALPDAAVAQPLSAKAAAEAIVRIYARGLATLMEGRQPVGAAAAMAAGLFSMSGSTQTLFDVLLSHYSPQQQHQQQVATSGLRNLAVQPYNASLWQDANGPVTRLLVSCHGLSPSSTKVALFCCLAGTQTPACSQRAWGVQHWRQLLLLLHAIKRLTGGLWKALLRDWGSLSGALLPLPCVHDLLGNTYNCSSLAALEQQAAVLGAQQLLQAGPGDVPSPPVLQHSSVAAALQELLVDGPLGPSSAVDFDGLLAMLMVQWDAGLLPLHPLLQPRRLATGDLANTTNAWGSAATEAASTSGGGGRLQLQHATVEASDSGRSDWGWLSSSRPTTAANSRLGTAPGGGLTLPRIRTPDSEVRRTASSSGGGHGLASPSGSSSGGHLAAATHNKRPDRVAFARDS